jgi:hypothetical protein
MEFSQLLPVVFLIYSRLFIAAGLASTKGRKQRASLSFSSLRAAALVAQLLRAISFINLPPDRHRQQTLLC